MKNLFLEDIEDIILGMAQIVEERRMLEDENIKLRKELDNTRGMLNKHYENSIGNVAKLLDTAISLTVKNEIGDE